MSATKHCGGCGVELTAEELHYYGYSCERCERQMLEEMDGATEKVLMPLEPTEAMLRAGWNGLLGAGTKKAKRRRYKRLLRARPTPAEG